MFRTIGASSTAPPLPLLLLAVALSACSTAPRSVYQSEQFTSAGAFARTYSASASATCEAARRALLSHGYLVPEAKAGRIDGHKSFQPEADTHLEIEFHVVCASNGNDDTHSTAFVNALQDRYTLRKTSNSASVGVGAVGSFSLPFGSSDDALVKIASETIPVGPFYERFFDLIEHYLAQDRGSTKASSAKIELKGEDKAKDKAEDNAPAPDSSPP